MEQQVTTATEKTEWIAPSIQEYDAGKEIQFGAQAGGDFLSSQGVINPAS